VKNLFNSSNPTIGVVIPVFWSGHFSESLKGILDASSQFHTNLICFQGTYFGGNYSSDGQVLIDKSGNIIFDLIKKIKIDGLILHTGSLRSHQHKIELIDFCKNALSIPMVNIGSSIEGITNIQVGNECGMKELLEHVIDIHGFHKFGFIRGPVESSDAMARFDTFQKVLSEKGIPINPDLITPPRAWSFDSGKTGTRELLDISENDLDVIVCPSDLLATGAIDELNQRGIKVPRQIGVIGFNDNNFAEVCVPPLTTVNMKLYERSWKAVEILSEVFSGTPMPQNVIVPSSLVIRQSCGCQHAGLKAVCDVTKNDSITLLDTHLSANSIRDELNTKIFEIFQLPNDSQLENATSFFVNCFISQLDDFTKQTFIIQFSEILLQTIHIKDKYYNWHNALNILEKALPGLLPDSGLLEAKQCILQARVLVNEVAEQKYRYNLMIVEEHNASINSLNYGLNKVSTLDSIIDLMAQELPHIGIPSCYLSLYEDPETPLQNSRLILACNKDGRKILPRDGIIFPSNQLIPDEILINSKNDILIIEPLFFGSNQLGFTLFEIGSLEKSFYALFPSQLSAALWGAILFAKEQQTKSTLQDQAQKLELSNAEIHESTMHIEVALQQLKEDRFNLLTTEKMASLGRFTAGITHEMSTPLATLRASLSELKKLALEYKGSINDSSVTPEDHQEIIKEFSSSMYLANKAATRVSDFIRSIKAQTRDIKGSEQQLFNIIDIIDDVVVFLSHSLKLCSCKVNIVNSDVAYNLFGSPTKLTQVFTNLISNAIDALENTEDRTITIELLQENPETTLIKISDNGCGIPQDNLTKIFEPMFTTKPFGQGTGLGLSIVYDIITLEFGGSIDVVSKIGTGTTFNVHIK
jgi:DNA-binding LacI/PurR family transcriptional regulator/signal transduction histidine kinase